MTPQAAKQTLLLTLLSSAIIVAFSKGEPNEKTRRFIGFGALFLMASFAVEAAPALGAGIAILTTVSLILQHGGSVFNAATKAEGRPWQPWESEGSVIPEPLTPAQPTTGNGSGAPSKGKGAIIGTPYKGTHTLGNWESDNAVDISLPIGTPILAPFAGKIGQDRKFGQFDSRARFKGLRLYVSGNHGEAAFLAHLSGYASGLRQGMGVQQGQVIGKSGDANGVNHLHFAVRPPASPYSYYKKVFR